MNGADNKGIVIGANNKYFTRNGEPWYPLMGEMHYNRVPPENWEEEILKMKAANLSIIATYVFWNEHETEPGKWNWQYGRNLRHFIQLCAKHGMYVWLRIGPWSHGEQLYGGFPEWIEKMKEKRSNAPAYLAKAKVLYDQIADQTKALYYSDGGPVIGIQLENEYATGQQQHISALKKMAVESGIHPVFWSVTSNSLIDETKTEVIPLQGSYPYRGWERAGGGPTKDFLYGDDQWIMTGAFGKVYYNINKYPKGLCEQGCGSQMTDNNRFVVEPWVVEAHLQNQIGRGMNMIGYYMFRGGTQTAGLEEPGYPRSYDFQAPISEFGLLRPSYRYLKILHNFIRDFGSDLAAMQVILPEDPVTNERDTTRLRYAARVKNNGGFLFLCNTQVRVHMPDKRVKLRVKTADGIIEFPEILIKGQTAPILPFNLNIAGVNLRYATAQPFAKIDGKDTTTVFFQELPGVKAELAFSGDDNVSAVGWHRDKNRRLMILKTGSGKTAILKKSDGHVVQLVCLSREDAENSWRFSLHGTEYLAITAADMLNTENNTELRQLGNTHFKVDVFPTAAFTGNTSRSGIFERYEFTAKTVDPGIQVTAEARGNSVITLPESLNPVTSDLIANVDYAGGACELLINGKVATDNLFNGDGSWQIGLKQFLGQRTATLNVKPWTDNITGVLAKRVANITKSAPSIQKVTIVPQYKYQLHSR
nr:beta-galactosidase [Chitinophaga polysaccharea]